MKAAFVAPLVMTMLATPTHADDFQSGVVHGAIGCPAAGDLHRGAELMRAGDSPAKALTKLHCRCPLNASASSIVAELQGYLVHSNGTPPYWFCHALSFLQVIWGNGCPSAIPTL
jgi:hypothetical protein